MSARDLSQVERRCMSLLRMLCVMLAGMLGVVVIVPLKVALVGLGPIDGVVSFGAGMAGGFLFLFAEEALQVDTPWRAIVVTLVLSTALLGAVALIGAGAA